MEKIVKPASGFAALAVSLVLLAAGIYCFTRAEEGGWFVAGGVTGVVLGMFILNETLCVI